MYNWNRLIKLHGSVYAPKPFGAHGTTCNRVVFEFCPVDWMLEFVEWAQTGICLVDWQSKQCRRSDN